MDVASLGSLVVRTSLLVGLAIGGLALGWHYSAPPTEPGHVADATPSSIARPHIEVAPSCGVVVEGLHRAGNLSGGALALAPQETYAAVADADNASVALVDLRHPEAAAVALAFPVRSMPGQVLVGTDGRIFVAERGSNTVSVYDPSGARRCSIEVATDPFGLAVSPDEKVLYVTSGLGRTLTAIDTQTFRVRSTTPLAREPRGITLSSDGHVAYVSHLAGAPLTRVSLEGGSEGVRETVLPTLPLSHPAITRGGIDDMGPPEAAQEVSQAWTAVFDAETQSVLVPMMLNRTGREVPVFARLDRYGAGAAQPSGSKLTFAIARFDTAHDRWIDVLQPPDTTTVPTVDAEGTVHTTQVRVPVSAAWRPADRTLLVASLGTNDVVAIPIGPMAAPVPHPTPIAIGLPNPVARRQALAQGAAPVVAVTTVGRTSRAPSAVAVTREGRVVVYSQFDHGLDVLGTVTLLAAHVSIGIDPLAPEVALGRRLFYTANDARISSGGLACAGCHPDGRDDGLTWFLQRGPRQTPTLAGRLIAPFNWNGTAETSEANIAQTVTRLGGTGLHLAEIDALAAFLSRGIFTPRPSAHALDEVEQRGRKLFTGVANCASCHDVGRNFTDGQAHELAGLGADETVRTFDTPSLRYVAATAPYFHDARYADLRTMLTDPTHPMGRVDLLSSRDVDAMIAYLQTL